MQKLKTATQQAVEETLPETLLPEIRDIHAELRAKVNGFKVQ